MVSWPSSPTLSAPMTSDAWASAAVRLAADHRRVRDQPSKGSPHARPIPAWSPRRCAGTDTPHPIKVSSWPPKGSGRGGGDAMARSSRCCKQWKSVLAGSPVTSRTSRNQAMTVAARPASARRPGRARRRSRLPRPRRRPVVDVRRPWLDQSWRPRRYRVDVRLLASPGGVTRYGGLVGTCSPWAVAVLTLRWIRSLGRVAVRLSRSRALRRDVFRERAGEVRLSTIRLRARSDGRPAPSTWH